jgi:O-succinylhomoserine sulfhydrylase
LQRGISDRDDSVRAASDHRLRRHKLGARRPPALDLARAGAFYAAPFFGQRSMAKTTSDNPADWEIATRLVRGGSLRSQYGETAEAIFLTQSFLYDSAEAADARFAGADSGFIYSRYANPTVQMFENRLALLEGAEDCRAQASGMAAVHLALMGLVRAGDHILAGQALFGSNRWILNNWAPRFGVETTMVPGPDIAAWRAAVRPNTKVFLLESPANPLLEITDIAAVSAIAREIGAKVVVDNVFASPILQKPLQLGADVVVYSATKHIDGQGRVLGGAVLGSRKWITETLQPFIRNTGPAMSPFNAWVLLKGLETLALRVDAGCRGAVTIAEFLAARPEVTRVWYPTRADHPQQALALQQMTAGGTVVTFEVAGGKDAAFSVMNAFGLIAVSNNLGDSKSLATHPATTTHMRIGPEERAKLGITDGVIRLSIGLEDAEDLKDDLARALATISDVTAQAAD